MDWMDHTDIKRGWNGEV